MGRIDFLSLCWPLEWETGIFVIDPIQNNVIQPKLIAVLTKLCSFSNFDQPQHQGVSMVYITYYPIVSDDVQSKHYQSKW